MAYTEEMIFLCVCVRVGREVFHLSAFCYTTSPHMVSYNEKAPLRDESEEKDAVYVAFDLLYQEGSRIFCLPT